MASSIGSHYRRIVGGALVLYCFWAGLLILQNPGLQYDEALLVLGAVHMRHPQADLSLGQEPSSWICFGERCLPLMTVPYAGAVKEYLCLPPFSVFGPRAQVLRVVSMLLGLLGIWGISRLISGQASPVAGAAAAWILAMNPAYVDLTVFDNGTVAAWMGSLGLVSLAASAYLSRQSARAAFWLGLAAGLGIWARANFLWLLTAIAAATLIVMRGRISVAFSQWSAAFAGALVGGAPFLVYLVRSRGETWRALKTFSSHEPLQRLLPARLTMLAETLLSDREHRAMWAGPAMPPWERWLFLYIVLLACAVCFFADRRTEPKRSLWARGAGLCFLFLAGILVLSRLMVAEHHLIVLVPVAAIVVALAASILWRTSRTAVAVTAILYFSLAVYWQVAAVWGLWTTGGVGQWSDAVFDLAEYLQRNYADREIKILDWGLDDNLYVLSDGRIRAREIYGDASGERSQTNRPWIEEIRAGGVFLMNGPGNRQFPAVSVGFLEALDSAKPSMRRFTVRQRNDVPYAEIFDIEPARATGLPEAIADDGSIGSEVITGDPKYARQLEGMYGIEDGWRWTQREFSVILRAPPARAGGRLRMQFTIPASSIERLGALTLTARIGGRVLGSETYRSAGDYTFERGLDAGWLKPGPNRIEFSLDKAIRPSSTDGRELGVIMVSARLE